MMSGVVTVPVDPADQAITAPVIAQARVGRVKVPAAGPGLAVRLSHAIDQLTRRRPPYPRGTSSDALSPPQPAHPPKWPRLPFTRPLPSHGSKFTPISYAAFGTRPGGSAGTLGWRPGSPRLLVVVELEGVG